MTMNTVHLSISGLVQGVGYRWTMAARARELGLTGWVRNRRNGSVEALVSGSAEGLEHLLAWARRGPPAAVVRDVVVTPASAPESDSFQQLPTC